jgi:hypothetical protein
MDIDFYFMTARHYGTIFPTGRVMVGWKWMAAEPFVDDG